MFYTDDQTGQNETETGEEQDQDQVVLDERMVGQERPTPDIQGVIDPGIGFAAAIHNHKDAPGRTTNPALEAFKFSRR
ncbi:hypothetical protein [Asticcacaulis taihuensis]|uniref:hypothetical protein n=1 Tax=Asticcacaulis taihuensis TaxID=260084 RepID=UPI0026EAAC64|nr:hypothetical protein [Asticcacaulis taihuensis]